MEDIKKIIEQSFENRQNINKNTQGDIREAVYQAINGLDNGRFRLAEQIYAAGDGQASNWQVNQWLKKAILLYFLLEDMRVIEGAPNYPGSKASWYDKVPSKFDGWEQGDFVQAGFRAVPGCFVRKSAYIAPKAVLMPSFVNVGAYVDEGTMVDTWATIGSCAQIGKNCHISGGAGIGGVLEPLQANPVIIEDDCFIGARSEVAEGVIVEKGSVLSMGVYIGASTKIVDRESGEIYRGRVPSYSVVVPGNISTKDGLSLYCAVIVKKVDEQTRSKTAVNELLREFG